VSTGTAWTTSKTAPTGDVVGTTDTQTLTNKTFGNATVISDNSSSAALRITQTGTGDALVVEDSATPDSTPFVVDASGRVGIGGTPAAGRALTVSKNITGATISTAVRADGQIESDVTSEARGFSSNISVANSAFTISSLRHFYAGTGTIGASATVTTQAGFFVESTLTGATNNHGFYSNIAAGTGRWNFYANGTADNYFAGNVGIGVTTPQAKFDLGGDYKEGVVTANTGTAYTISLSTGTLQILTLTGNCTFTFPTATAGKSFTLLLKQDATGSRTVTWPSAVKWPGGTAPTITSTASKLDKYVFTSDGTNWYGSNAGQNYSV
jgi:hypothetical protein